MAGLTSDQRKPKIVERYRMRKSRNTNWRSREKVGLAVEDIAGESKTTETGKGTPSGLNPSGLPQLQDTLGT